MALCRLKVCRNMMARNLYGKLKYLPKERQFPVQGQTPENGKRFEVDKVTSVFVDDE